MKRLLLFLKSALSREQYWLVTFTTNGVTRNALIDRSPAVFSAEGFRSKACVTYAIRLRKADYERAREVLNG